MPFKLREFMVKNWKRHRDVPTNINDLVDKTFDDLRARKLELSARSELNAIKPEKLLKVNNLLKDIRVVVEKESLEVSNPSFASLKLKIIEVRAAEDGMEKEVFDLQMAHRQLIRIGQLGPKGQAQYQRDLQNTQLLTRLSVVSKKRRKDQPSHPEAEANIAPVAQAVPHERETCWPIGRSVMACLCRLSPRSKKRREKNWNRIKPNCRISARGE